jgi:tetratricopeptide (TPR) repeat protein
MALGSLGKHEEAIECFDRVISLDENNVGAWHNKGYVLIQIAKNYDAVGIGKQYQNAMDCFDRVISLDENNVDAWLYKGSLSKSLGMNQKALECFDRVISLVPNNLDALISKGEALFDLEKYRDARHCFDEVLKNDESNQTAWEYKCFISSKLASYDVVMELCNKALTKTDSIKIRELVEDITKYLNQSK